MLVTGEDAKNSKTSSHLRCVSGGGNTVIRVRFAATAADGEIMEEQQKDGCKWLQEGVAAHEWLCWRVNSRNEALPEYVWHLYDTYESTVAETDDVRRQYQRQ